MCNRVSRMGVYCFRWLDGHRGWRSVVVPDPLLRSAAPERFELLYWNQDAPRSVERKIHKRFAARASSVGEWYPDTVACEITRALREEHGNAPPVGGLEAAKKTRRRL